MSSEITQPTHLDADLIITNICTRLKVTLPELISTSRVRRLVDCRKILAYQLYHETRMTFHEIGQLLQNWLSRRRMTCLSYSLGLKISTLAKLSCSINFSSPLAW